MNYVFTCQAFNVTGVQLLFLISQEPYATQLHKCMLV